MKKLSDLNRRSFLGLLGAGSLGLAVPVKLNASIHSGNSEGEKPLTNGKDALKFPRTKSSMPGLYPAKVVRVRHDNAILEGEPDENAAYQMIAEGLQALMGTTGTKKALRQLVEPKEIIGLKVNPVAGKSLSTSHAVVRAMIRHLEEAGIPRKNLVIWDRREFQLFECGFTAEAYPGIRIAGTERQDSAGSYYSSEGKLYGEEMIDKEWYYWADVEGEYDEYTMPYMVNGGKYSYFSKICTQELDKIINIPILKNAGNSVTLALKNLAYGAVTNTGRLHQDLWAETCAEVCSFPPLRDKVVLNVVDGIRGCFNGGPAANPQFFTNYGLILLGTDPVAVDRIGYDIVIKKRISEGLMKEETERGKMFLSLANEIGLGESDINKILLIDKKIA